MRPFLLVVVTAFVYLFSVSPGAAQNSLAVNELKTQLFFSESGAEVILAIETASRQTSTQIGLEVLTPNNSVVASALTKDFPLKKGANAVKIPLVFAPNFTEKDWLLYRLRYQLTAANEIKQGFIGVSEIAPEVFELQATAGETVRENSKYRAQVQAVHPVSKRGIADVALEAELRIEIKIPDDSDEEDEIIVKATGKTDAEGFAVLDFTVPQNVRLDDDAEIEITGRKNGLTRTVTEDLSVFAGNFVYLNTDKPIYQPAQMLNFRILAMNSGNFVLSDVPLKIKIEDEEGETMHRAEIKTSRFGIASYSWQIPENAKLGRYEINVENDAFDIDRTATFKVSRYDLPNFAVFAKPDKTFYLPENDTAEIEIRADYLFGKPVTKGKVRVVQELEREWNYKAQKYEINEGESREGELEANGKFVAKFDLKKEHEDFESSSYRKFKDLNFVAYLTDLTTNKTEQRRFDVRLTKEPIHIYLIGDTYTVSDKLNPKYYLTTFYADGTPVSCQVSLNQTKKIETDNDKDEFENVRLLSQFQTDSRGAAKLEFPLNAFPDLPERLYFQISATAKDGKRGTLRDDVYLDKDKSTIQVTTDKTIYKHGEKMKVAMTASEPAANVFIEVRKDWNMVFSARRKLADGYAEFEIPYRREFKNEVKISAFYEFEDEIVAAAKTVIFPSGRGLTVKADTKKSEFRPGEDAEISFQTTKADGKTGETALGVVILDKALEERARTEGEFGGYRDYWNLLGYESFNGLTRKDLMNLDLRQPITPEFELSAEILLNRGNYFRPNFFRSREYAVALRNAYSPQFAELFVPVGLAFDAAYNKRREFPQNETTMREILQAEGIDFDKLRDAWGNPFRTSFRVERNLIRLEVLSDGADKKAATDDDILAFRKEFFYFLPLGEKLSKAVLEYEKETGEFLRDLPTLRAEMLKKFQTDIESWRDPWGNPYRFRFDIEGSNYVIFAESAGEGGKFDDDYTYRNILLWQNYADYFQVTRQRLAQSVTEIVRKNGEFPADEAGFKAILKKVDFDIETEKDVFKRSYYLTRSESSRYGNRVQVRNVGETQAKITPITQQLVTFRLKSVGFDGIRETNDDFELVRFTGVVAEKTKESPNAQDTVKKILIADGKGAIAGTIFDLNGAVVPNTTCTAKNTVSGVTVSVVSNDEGYFVFNNLEAGIYEMSFTAAGFRKSILTNVPVEKGNTTDLEISLEIGSVTETVNVTSERASLETSSSIVTTFSESKTFEFLETSSLSFKRRGFSGDVNFITKSGTIEDEIPNIPPSETPRLREYFPETLLWSPEIITDKRGRAEVRFKLADSITTWKIGVIASNLEGEIGITEKEIQAFRPFFADHDPPKFLTAGDRIFLPVVLRNYLETAQTVNVSMKEESWFKLNGAARQKITVAPADSSNAIFDFRAVDYIKDGKQRVTALASEASDAIEKPVTVRPNGKEIVKTESKIFQDSAVFDVNFPAETLSKTAKAEVKIYPNLTAHVAEAIEGILRRPYGCAEQTISSTYPNLLWLKLNRNDTATGNSALNTKARRYLKQGYERLLGYQQPDGSFGYWANDTANLPLTAYAFRFLSEAQGFIEIDKKVLEKTGDFLRKQQREDGTWTQVYSHEKGEDAARTKQITAYVARILAVYATSKEDTEAAKKAFAYLKTRADETDDPYFAATFALTAFALDETETGQKMLAKLRATAKSEGTGTYWNLERNTPFFGWGLTGRIETTALVLQAFLADRKAGNSASETAKDLQDAGIIQFLLKNKDRYGVWYSTQATINVLDALTAALKNEAKAEAEDIPRIEIFVNGQKASSELLPKANTPINPILAEISPFLSPTNNKIEIKQTGTKNFASVQVVRSYYVPWTSTNETDFTSNESRGLRLKVDFDRTNARIGEEITCYVEAERIGFQGYGMLLAEIGIPPGADVQRESLEKARQADWDFSRYDVLPDRIIFYLWAKPNGNKLSFKFKPRYGIEANNPASTIYDYYNPESNATVAPTKFVVNE